jgi:tRNA U34 5-methylaminomethyl-2-thiouridine-forming methyltransferase MnmC
MIGSHQILLSEDGTHTLHSAQFGVTYHSIHGALAETMKVFIESGIDFRYSRGLKNIRILEMGFGTGLNALCTLKKSLEENINFDYITIEAFPIGMDTVTQLNFIDHFNIDLKNDFYKMHQSNSGESIQLGSMKFEKYITPIEDWTTDKKFDIIFYDAFAPASQPHLWEGPMMHKMYELLDHQGILCTYCAKGSFKRVLKECGFHLEALPGPGRKREITRATKL